MNLEKSIGKTLCFLFLEFLSQNAECLIILNIHLKFRSKLTICENKKKLKLGNFGSYKNVINFVILTKTNIKMRKMKITQNVLFYSLAFTLLSCGGDSGEVEPDAGDNSITEITISADKTAIKPTGIDKITLTAVDQNGNDISDSDKVNYFANGTRISRNYGTTSKGNITIEAKTIDGKVKSNQLRIVSGIGEVTAIKIQTDITSVKANGFSKIRLSATDQDNDLITDFVDFYADDQKLKTHYFTSRDAGSFNLKAKYLTVESDPVPVQAAASSSRGRKVLIEEFTGEWCGWCPCASYNLGLLASIGDAVIMSAIHFDDKYAYRNARALQSALESSGAPDALVNRRKTPENAYINAPDIEHKDFQPVISLIESILEETTQLGIAIETELSGSEVIIKPKFKFYESISSAVYYTIYINESKLDGSGQQNYFTGRSGYEESVYYSQPRILTDYEHDHVLRTNGTDALGDRIPDQSVVANGIYEPNPITVSLSNYVVANCEIVVFAHFDTKSSGNVLNAQKVAPGESIDYIGQPSK